MSIETDTSQVNWQEVAKVCIRHKSEPIMPMGAECLRNIISGACAYVEFIDGSDGGSYYAEREVDQRPTEVIARGEVVQINPDIL